MSDTVVLLGADGFIGRHIAFVLRDVGFQVRAIARRPAALRRMGFEAVQVDLCNPRWHDPSAWADIVGPDAHVVNAAGLLTGRAAQFEAVHVLAPKAAYAAMSGSGRVVLISAVGIEADTDFAKWRRDGEAVVPEGGVVLRPGLVMAETSYGGTSLSRALAAMPCVVPVVGEGDQAFNPVHAHDLAELVAHSLRHDVPIGPHEIGGPETITQEGLLLALRGWFGLRAATSLKVPLPVARVLGRIGDALRLGPISATAVAQLEHGVFANPSEATKSLLSGAPELRGVSRFLSARPCGTQDLWHARLYLLRPVLRLCLAFMWLVSAALGVFLPLEAFISSLNGALSPMVALFAARAGGLIDLAIGVALLRGWRPRLVGGAQLAMVGAYTVGLTAMAPALWLLPYGGVLKNLPVLLLILVWIVLEDER